MAWLCLAWAAMSAACACIALTVTKAKVTAPLRAAVLRIPRVGLWLGALLSCPYCFAHWVSLAMVVGYDLRLFAGPKIVGWLLTAAALTTTSSLLASTVFRNYKDAH